MCNKPEVTQKCLHSPNGTPKAVFIDAKQRAILSSPHPRPVNDSKSGNAIFTFCAEPSPDALSAIAASQGLTLSKADAFDVASSLSLSEGAGSIGLRTQSIQLMRDTMYRICKGYMSGALNNASWQTLHRRLQSSMVAILAIEQITGVVRAPAVNIGGSAITESAELVAKYTEKTEAARTGLRDSEESLEKLERELGAANKAVDDKTKERDDAKTVADAASDSDKKAKTDLLAAKQSELDKLTESRDAKKKERNDGSTKVQEAKDAFTAYDKARKFAVNGSTRASTTVSVDPPENCCARDKESIKAIGDNVADIVKATLALNFSREVCASIFTNAGDGTTLRTPKAVLDTCLDYMDETVKSVAVKNKVIDSLADRIAKGDDLKPELIDGTIELFGKFGESGQYNILSAPSVSDKEKKVM